MNETRLLDDLLKKEGESVDQEITPKHNLWLAIEKVINNTPLSRSKIIAIAASVVLIIGVVFSSGIYLGQMQEPSLGFDELITLLQEEHENRKLSLLAEYQNQEALSPDWELQMVQMEAAEQVIYDALNNDPSNQPLLKILKQVQSQQINLITSVYAKPAITI